MGYVIGFDLGTSFFKCAIVDREGNCLSVGRVETPKKQKGSYVLINPSAFWEAIQQCVSSACSQAGIEASEIDGICYGSQANTFLMMDSDFEPITDLIVWTTKLAEELSPEYERFFTSDEFSDRSGYKGLGMGSMVSNFTWLRDNRPDLVEKAAHLFTISDLFMYGITGNRASDSSSASLLGLLDVHTNDWNELFLEKTKIDRKMLGTLHRIGDFIGTCSTPLAKEIGFSPKAKLFSGGLDHVISAYGSGVGSIGDASESTGTVLGAVTLKNSFAYSPKVYIGPAMREGEFSYLAFFDKGASAFEMVHDMHYPDLTFADMFPEAARSPIGANQVIFDDMQDAFLSPDGVEGRAEDKLRAVNETLAFRLLELIEHLTNDHEDMRIVSHGGGNKSRQLLQTKADMFNCTMRVGREKELGTYGAAMIAACGLAWFPTIEEVQEAWVRVLEEFVPDKSRHEEYLKWLPSRRAIAEGTS